MCSRKLGCLVFLRNLSSQVNPDHAFKKPLHPFKIILTKKIVLDHLAQNIIYRDDKIAVFNKPPDVAKAKETNPNIPPPLIPRVYMDDLLPDVAKLVPELKDITIAKFPERYTSGIMIVSTKSALPFIEKCKRRAKGGQDLCDKYLTITQGQPIMNRGVFKLAVKLAKHESTQLKVPILVDTWSSEDMKKQRVSAFRLQHSVVSTGPLSSLTEVSISDPGRNAIRLFLATKMLSPLLGDNIFASRVKGLLGVPLLIDPWSDVANSPKRLPSQILTMLKLNSNETNLVPPMIHLEQVRLPGYFKNEDLVLRAPVSSMFSWTCQQLELTLNQNLIPQGDVEGDV